MMLLILHGQYYFLTQHYSDLCLFSRFTPVFTLLTFSTAIVFYYFFRISDQLFSQNIALSIAQVDRLQDMEEKASKLEDSSSSFQRNASRVRRKMCVRSYKMLALIIFLVLVLLVIIIVPIVCKSTSC